MLASWALWAFALIVSSVAATPSRPAQQAQHVISFPGVAYNGSITAEMTSKPGNLDGQKVLPWPNATTYEWWYFDAVSTSTNESIVVVFFETGQDSFALVTGVELSVSISGTFKNGTAFNFLAPALNATITVSSDEICGDWGGSGCTFHGSGLTWANPVYTINLDVPFYGVEGKLTLNSVAPAHYPCNLDSNGVTEVVVPHVGWANAQPDSNANVDITIGDTQLSFQGLGYHDKNWGDGVPFQDAIQSWYWGHARVGPYSVVWFDTQSRDGSEYVSGFVAQDGHVLLASCAAGAVRVRPYGANSTYPPLPTTPAPETLLLSFDLPGASTFSANVTTKQVTVDAGTYQRYTGTVRGGFEGEEQYDGVALYEEFKLAQ